MQLTAFVLPPGGPTLLPPPSLLQMVSNHVSHDSLLRCIQYFHTLLLFHPPGQHGTVDAVYAEFVGSLGPQVGTFAAWDEIDCLIRCVCVCVCMCLPYGGFIVWEKFFADLLLCMIFIREIR